MSLALKKEVETSQFLKAFWVSIFIKKKPSWPSLASTFPATPRPPPSEMESQDGCSFYRIILDHNLRHAFLDIPQEFLDEHGKKLSKYAYLEVPTGEKWKVKLKRHEGRIRLCKGLRKFFSYYCIDFGYFLVFKYKGESLFHVLIFHPTAVEIDYHCNVEPSSKDREDSDHGDDVSVVILEDNNDIKEEEADFSPEIQDETVIKKHKKRKVLSANESGQKRDVTSARVKIVQRAKAFCCPNPHFIVQMSQAYLSSNYMHIPQSHAKIYFKKAKNGGLYLEGENGRACFVEYSVRVGSCNHVRLHTGWNDFAQENHLQIGDVCIFELINRATRTYKVTVFRIADQEDTNTNGLPEVLDENMSFTVSMTPSLLSCRNSVRLPLKHSRRYLQYNEPGENVVTFVGSSGEKWKILYNITPSEPDRARLSNKWWRKFVLENQLQVGDICDFEMISGKVKEYKVTITRGF